MSEPELTELRNFVLVAEFRNFTRAAQRAGLSTPAVSKSIKRLETKLEARLFERSSRRVELTLAGRVLLAHAERVLDALEAFKSALDQPSSALRPELRPELAISPEGVAPRPGAAKWPAGSPLASRRS